jgi:tetratricopeptide (TPR) repeat protein
MMIATKDIALLKAEQTRLYGMTDADPAMALREARRLRDDGPHGMWTQLRACVLTEAGSASKNKKAVEEGTEIFRIALAAKPDDPMVAYNLANALSALAKLDGTKHPQSYLQTAGLRLESRALYGSAAMAFRKKSPKMATQCLTNVGNALDHAFRWIEAFEAYVEALSLYPENGVASGAAAEVLLRVSRTGRRRGSEHLRAVALRLAGHSQKHAATVRAFAGESAAHRLARLPSHAGPPLRVTKLGLSRYQLFVAQHRLALSPVVEGLRSLRRWDDLHITAIQERSSAGSTMPPLLAMFNLLKSDYLLARELLFEGFQDKHRDTGWYADTLDYAVYGRKTSCLVLAQRSALDLLDRIAVALNDYLGVGVPPTDVHFVRFWLEPKASDWRKPISDEIRAGNPALIALAEIATDLGNTILGEGKALPLLYRHRYLRNSGTHRFTVLHDVDIDEHRHSIAIEHLLMDDFQRAAVDTLKLARAALFYLVEAIDHREIRLGRGAGAVGSLAVPGHHQVRGRR